MKEETKKCLKCQTENDINNMFCLKCGTKFNDKKKEKKREKEKKRKKILDKNVVIPIISLFIGALLMFLIISLYNPNLIQNVTKIEKDVTVTDTGIADAVEKIYDSVVVIENYQNDSLIATGSGFVFKSNNDKGYILTNNHVIDSASEIYLTFTNGTREKATLVGSDTYSDIAVLSVDKEKIISVANIGSSENLRIGDTTFAIGTPLNYEVYSWSVTRGIISGKDRLVEVSLSNNYRSDYVMKVLQTDAAINSGNSGGPLCNSNGEVIGITNMKLAASNIEGMGFAIPIEKAIKYAEKFINGEVMSRPYLGITMYDLSSLKNGMYKINTNLEKGIYISSVENDSPAFNAGLKEGDIITKIDNIEVANSAYLRYLLYEHNIGDEITITYYRSNKENTTKIKLLQNSDI